MCSNLLISQDNPFYKKGDKSIGISNMLLDFSDDSVGLRFKPEFNYFLTNKLVLTNDLDLSYTKSGIFLEKDIAYSTRLKYYFTKPTSKFQFYGSSGFSAGLSFFNVKGDGRALSSLSNLNWDNSIGLEYFLSNKISVFGEGGYSHDLKKSRLE